jgi:hypothetical protein
LSYADDLLERLRKHVQNLNVPKASEDEDNVSDEVKAEWEKRDQVARRLKGQVTNEELQKVWKERERKGE